MRTTATKVELFEYQAVQIFSELLDEFIIEDIKEYVDQAIVYKTSAFRLWLDVNLDEVGEKFLRYVEDHVGIDEIIEQVSFEQE